MTDRETPGKNRPGKCNDEAVYISLIPHCLFTQFYFVYTLYSRKRNKLYMYSKKL